MYYKARAVLQNLGYKVGREISHKIVSDAILVLLRERLREELIKDFEEVKGEALEIIAAGQADSVLEMFDFEDINVLTSNMG